MATTQRDPVPDFLQDPEPRAARYTIMSADDHVVEAPDTFVGRLPARLADRAPRIVELEVGTEVSRAHQGLPTIVAHKAGRQVWEYEGKIFAQVGLNAVVGHTDYAAGRFEPTSFAEMRPGCFEAGARVGDMDLAGIWSSVNFPSSIAGFCGSVFSASDDKELGHAVMRAWNDWIHDEWSAPYPDRFIGAGLTWLADVGSSGMLPLPPGGPRFEKNITLFPAVSLLAATEWVWSGVLQRFPALKIVMSEGGIGWVPMLLDRLDYRRPRREGWGPPVGGRALAVGGAAPEFLVLHARRPVDAADPRSHRIGPGDDGGRLPTLGLHLARLPGGRRAVGGGPRGVALR